MKKTKQRKCVLAMKIDLEKEYDNVNWDFFFLLLKQFSFPRIIVRFIMWCVTNSSLSILWNGSRLQNLWATPR